jgi:hypothetical protein
MVKVSNEIGATQSNTVSAFAADTPATPANPVTFDADHTNTTSIRVIMDQIDDDGGAEILLITCKGQSLVVRHSLMWLAAVRI